VQPQHALIGHARVAHGLLPSWTAAPQDLYIAIDAQLSLWATRSATSASQLLGQIAATLSQHTALAPYGAAITAVSDQDVDDAFKLMCSEALQTAEDLHRRVGRPFIHRPTFEAAVARDNPFPDEFDYCTCAASGSCVPATPTTGAAIRVGYWLARFGPPTWAATPRVLLHELICHAAQTSPIDNADPFTEGFLDVVAEHQHESHVDRLFPWDPAMALEAGRGLSVARRRAMPTGRHFEGMDRAARRRGYAAGEIIHRRLVRLSAPGRAVEDFARLAIHLNTSTIATYNQKAAFIEDVIAAELHRYSDPATDIRLSTTLAAWIGGNLPAEDVLCFT
jgi:hypothetical protein